MGERSQLYQTVMSLSARRAWIEIGCVGVLGCWSVVALRKESVDRNARLWACLCLAPRSLSARRAWIEMYLFELAPANVGGRSPQGERG